MSKEVENQEIEKQEEQELKIGDMVDFPNVYKVRGLPGLWEPKSRSNKSGMMGIQPFLDATKTKICKVSDVTPLSSYQFFDDGGNAINISKVFNNIQETGKDTTELKMNDLVPGFDPEQFKDYHFKQVVNWYRFIKTQIDKISDN